jgi:DNA-binding MarR family transcriptional regulator
MQPLDAREFERAAVDTVAAAVPGADLDALRASFDLIRASTRLVQRLEAEVHSPAGWSMAGFRVMFCVWVGGELEPRDIARLSGLSRAAVSSVLNTLERDGLVERSRESHDRRLVTVRLTTDGATRLVAAYERQNLVEREFFGGLGRGRATGLAGRLADLLDRPGTAGEYRKEIPS